MNNFYFLFPLSSVLFIPFLSYLLYCISILSSLFYASYEVTNTIFEFQQSSAFCSSPSLPLFSVLISFYLSSLFPPLYSVLFSLSLFLRFLCPVFLFLISLFLSYLPFRLVFSSLCSFFASCITRLVRKTLLQTGRIGSLL